jgi:DnaJ-class molecular chaperone
VKTPLAKDGTRSAEREGRGGFGGAAAGDLYVVTRVEPSKIYERRGDDPSSSYRFVPDGRAGGSVEAPTPEAPCR